jgi:hypothetical protein
MRRTVLAAVVTMSLVGLLGSPASAITYGTKDRGRHPEVGMLIGDFDGTYDWICSGTLISPTVFLTAAHCTDYLASTGARPHDVWVSFASRFSNHIALLRGTFHQDPSYGSGGENDPHDIAVVVLDHAVHGITPATVIGAGELASVDRKDQIFTAVGYGTERHTKQGGAQSIVGGGTRKYALQTANTLTDAWLKLSMNPSTGNAGSCYGDSGGPHFLGGIQSSVVASITITGDAVCKSTDTTYRLDTASARDFLQDYVTLP